MDDDTVIGWQIRDMRQILKELEPAVKGFDTKGRSFLINGNNSKKKTDSIGIKEGGYFKMRYREAWANWLLCAVLSYATKEEHTFQDDENGDGIILNKNTQKWFFVEHVSAMDFGTGPELPKGEARVVWAVNKKVEKEKKIPGYSKGKSLLIFLDGAELWYPNKAGRAIADIHNFASVYCVALIDVTKEGDYRYSVNLLQKNHSPSWMITLNKDFTDWAISRMQ